MSTTNDIANDLAKRQSIIDACLRMDQLGINQGTSGNISLRHEDGMLITPTSTPYDAMQPEQIVFMNLDGSLDAKKRPSSEWRFHRDILKARPEVNAVVHAHPPYATMLAIMGRMATYTGQEVTWDAALNSKDDLSPKNYAFGPNPVPPPAIPGVAKLV